MSRKERLFSFILVSSGHDLKNDEKLKNTSFFQMRVRGHKKNMKRPEIVSYMKGLFLP